MQESSSKILKTLTKKFNEPEEQENFWENLKKEGGNPIIEGIPDDDTQSKVTFYWKNESEENPNQEQQVYLVVGYPPGEELPFNETKRFKKIGDSNIYSLSLNLPNDLLTTYELYVQKPGVDMQKMIAEMEQNLKSVTDPEKRQKLLEPLHKVIIENGFQSDNHNSNRTFASAEKKEGESVLSMPNAPKNEYLSNQKMENIPKLSHERVIKFEFSYESNHYNFGIETLHKKTCTNQKECDEVMQKWQEENPTSEDGLIIQNLEDNSLWLCNSRTKLKAEGNLKKELETLLQVNILDSKRLREVIRKEINPPIQVYLPKDHHSHPEQKYPLLIQLDGSDLIHMGMPIMLDEMIEKGKIPPCIVVFVPTLGDRLNENRCNEQFLRFLADELIPKIKEKYRISNEAKDTYIAGYSVSGLGAIFAGLTRPDTFGNVISQSGSLWDCDKEIKGAIETFKKTDMTTHFSLTGGKLEIKILSANQSFAQSLGNNVTLKEFNSGHEFFAWQTTLDVGLKSSFQNKNKETMNQDVEVNHKLDKWF